MTITGSHDIHLPNRDVIEEDGEIVREYVYNRMNESNFSSANDFVEINIDLEHFRYEYMIPEDYEI